MMLTCSSPEVDRIWLWVYYTKIPIYPIFYLLNGDYSPRLALEKVLLAGSGTEKVGQQPLYPIW